MRILEAERLSRMACHDLYHEYSVRVLMLHLTSDMSGGNEMTGM